MPQQRKIKAHAKTQRRKEYAKCFLDVSLRSWVERKVIIDIESVEKVLPMHEKQVLTYLQQTGNKLGLLLNFNVPVIKDGIYRIVLGLEE